ncbi:hypothetical protein QBC34DRAFT_472711 [Podospora aff. communis PSN243]|uniref:FAD dependent oxidoreductase domain-containing protein n=1 Tax=Podospora aff. communis PSN243 TaxID=3040156 RepID=A0AAV9GBA5_9PEZI|nr:hypothetical protein QBC34DRAFT_472711 [Podospora aff. communis PSN243]
MDLAIAHKTHVFGPALFEIQLPYTKGQGVLHLTTDSRCYVQLAKDAFNNSPESFNQAKGACTHATETIQNVRGYITSLRSGHRRAQDAQHSVEIADASKTRAENAVRSIRTQIESLSDRAKSLFNITLKAATEAKDAAIRAFGEIATLRANFPQEHVQIATDVCQRMETVIKKALDTIVAEESLMGEYDRNNQKLVLVIGGGVSGLMTAWMLLDKGYRVTIVAKEWCQLDDKKADRMTSQIAGALWEYPPGGCGLSEIEVPVLAYSTLAQYRNWALQSFLFYQYLAGNSTLATDFGARMITLYQFFQKFPPSPSPANNIVPTDVVTRRAEESAQDHHNKWKEIEQLDTTPGDFYKKLQASRCKLRPSQAPGEGQQAAEADDDTWKPAKDAIHHGPDGLDLKWGYRHQAPVVDTDVAMKFLMKIVRGKGATLETRHIKEDLHLQERELMDDFKADIIVNASGLGANVLASDNQVFPVRGAVRRMTLDDNDAGELEKIKKDILPQVASRDWPALVEKHRKTAEDFLKDNAVLLPAQYDSHNRPGKTVFIVPRNAETIIVGSIIQRNNWDLGLTLESPEVGDMWKRAYGLVQALATRKPDNRPLAQGLRPFSHSNVRVSADNRTASCRVVHNYGHGGSGWTLAVGSAWTCVQIVERMLHRAESGSVANAQVWGLGGRD